MPKSGESCRKEFKNVCWNLDIRVTCDSQIRIPRAESCSLSTWFRQDELNDFCTERKIMKAATDKLSLALRAIADPNRRKILRLLRTKGTHRPGEPSGLNASDIEAKVKLAQPTISHHMKILKKAGLIEIQKTGTWVWYRRSEGSLKTLRSNIQDEL